VFDFFVSAKSYFCRISVPRSALLIGIISVP
jgi:hypothetical protein